MNLSRFVQQQIRVAALGCLVAFLPTPAQADANRESIKANNGAVRLANAGKFAEALPLINRSLELKPHDPTAVANKSRILRQLRRSPEALQFLTEELKRSPHSHELREEHKEVLESLNLMAQGRREFLLLAAEQPEVPRKLESVRMNYADWFLWEDALRLASGETRLEGIFQNLSGDRIQMETLLFINSNRKFGLTGGKPKTFELRGLEPEWPRLGALPATQLRSGDYLVVIGTQGKDGFRVRRVVVAPRSEAEEKQRGSLFDMAMLPEVEDQDYPELDPKAMGQVLFELSDGTSLGAAAAAVLRDGDRTALVTTASAFRGETERVLSGDPAQKTTTEIVELLGKTVRVRGFDAYEAPALDVELPLRVHLVKPYDGGEIVVIPLKNAPSALPLASKAPQRGDVIFLQQWYSGAAWPAESVVGYCDARRLFMRSGSLSEAERIPGSPIATRQGEVVGMHVNGNEPCITAVPLDVLRRALQAIPPESAPK